MAGNDGIEGARGRGDEVDLVAIAAHFWRRKWFLIGCMALAGASGAVYCLTATPLYYSQAVLTPKKSDRDGMGASLLSQFGGVGGMVAAQMGFGDNNLDKMEIVLRSRELADSVITRNSLLPVLFPERWDEGAKAWKPHKLGPPKVRDGVERLRGRILAVNANSKKEILNLGIFFHDPEWSARLAGMYVEELNRKIQSGVIGDAEFNKSYLENQLAKALDPLLREKIQGLIAMQVEKAMLVSSQSFSILENPAVPLRPDRPKKKLTVALFAFLGLVGSAMALGGARYWRALRPEFEKRLGEGKAR